jgi:hypothetical protein
MKRLLIAISILLLSVPCNTAALISFQKTDSDEAFLDKPNPKIASMYLHDRSIRDVVVGAMRNAGISGGVSVSYYCNGLSSGYPQTRTDTLRGILDTAVNADPRYAWEINNGTVNFLLQYNPPKFLEMTVSKFEVDDKEPFEALDQLLHLPEVRSHVSAEFARQAVSVTGTYPYNPNGAVKAVKRISVNVSNVTLREALNSIVRARGDLVWVLSTSDCSAAAIKTFSLDVIPFNF